MRPAITVLAPLPSPLMATESNTSALGGGLGYEEKRFLAVWLACCLLAIALPYPATKIAVGLILGVSYLQASLSSFHLALSGFIILLPFNEVAYKGSILLPGVNMQTLFVVYLLFVSAVVAEPEAGHADRNPLVAPVLVLLAVMTISALSVALSSNTSAIGLLTSVKNSFAYALLALIVFRRVKEPEHKLMVIVCVFLSVLVNVLFSLREVSQTLASGQIFMRHRAVSLISDQPNLYAGFLSMYLFFFIAFLMYYPSNRKYKLLLFGATVLVAINLVYTMSRGGWLACCLAGVFVMGTKARRLILPIAVLGMILYVWLPDMAVERGSTTFQGEYDPSLLVDSEGVDAEEAATRIVQWRSFLPMMAEHPIFGVGYGGFGRFFRDGGYYPLAKSAHSSVIQLGVELGLVGLVLYTWILVAAYRGGSRVFRMASQPIDRTLGLGLLAATICLFLLDLSGTRFSSGNIMCFYWILAGIALNSRPRELST
jgi:O-antigen ligase